MERVETRFAASGVEQPDVVAPLGRDAYCPAEVIGLTAHRHARAQLEISVYERLSTTPAISADECLFVIRKQPAHMGPPLDTRRREEKIRQRMRRTDCQRLRSNAPIGQLRTNSFVQCSHGPVTRASAVGPTCDDHLQVLWQRLDPL